MKILVSALFFFLCLVATAKASVTPAAWTTFAPNQASGTFNGVQVTATSNSGSPFASITAKRFSPSGSWEAPSGLPSSADAIGAVNVNGGEWQRFFFDQPASGMFYIENFDSSSVAEVVAVDATSLRLFDHSASISFNSFARNGGVLSTSNSSFDGEGDAVFRFEDASSIIVQFQEGVGDNGVFYTFSDPAPVPEPTSVIVMGGLFGLLGAGTYFRRRQQILHRHQAASLAPSNGRCL